MDKYIVVGNPINHSKSPLIHTLFACQTGQNMDYQCQLVALDGFVTAMDAFFADGGKGCNITVPFKEQAFEYATQLTQRAQLAGAVNTLKHLDDGTILGDNTDGEGLVQDLLQQHVELKDKRILLIGAGGAARGVILPLLAHQPQRLIISNRTLAKAQQLVVLFTEYGDVEALSFDDLNEHVFDVVINSTSASLSGDVPAIPVSIINSQTICYDMVYGSAATAFNVWSQQQGAIKTIDGLGMLVGQAAESFMLWRGLRPDAKQVQQELRRLLQE